MKNLILQKFLIDLNLNNTIKTIFIILRKYNKILRKLDLLNNVSYIKVRVFPSQDIEKYSFNFSFKVIF